MSDLAHLFPDLPRDILNDFENPGGGGQGGLNANGERGAITDEEIEAWLRQSGSLRAPLRPVVEGQRAPDYPEFATNARMAPPADNAYTEAPDYGDGTPTEQPPVQPPAQPPTAPTTPQQPPPSQPPADLPDLGEPGPSPTSPQPGDIPSSPNIPVVPESPSIEPPATPGDALAGLLAEPGFRDLLTRYLTERGAPAVSQPPPVPPAPPYTPAYLPPPSAYGTPPQPVPYASAPTPIPPAAGQPQFDEYTDPNVRLVYEQNQRLGATVAQLQQQQELAAQRQQEVQMNHFTQVVEGAVSQWGEKYQLPPNILQDVRRVAGRMGAAATYMNGIHPITGLPVVADPSEATKVALDIAYYSTPSARVLENQRTQQRMMADAQRRQKLAGVGGSSASVPRNPPAPTDAAGRRNGMLDEVGQMFRGEWTGGNPN